MKICKTCVLPENFPGISFDEDGRCSYCKRYQGRENQERLKLRFRQKFLDVLERTRGEGPYDAIVAYSGGKDSTYTLRLLKENYALKILAITFDHGFMSPMALENICNVTDNLGVHHLTFRPGASTLRTLFVKSMSRNLYPIKALERASSICNSCMNIVKSFLLKSAIEMRVPMVAYGWSPGQAPVQSSVFKMNGPMIRQMQKAMLQALEGMVQDELSTLFIQEHHWETGFSSQNNGFPYIVHPLAFCEYDEENILNEMKEIGWKIPKDTDSNSTNCLLNGLACQVHINQYGFHPYSLEIAELVRGGYMTREAGLKKLKTPPDPKVIEDVKKKLGVDEIP